MASTAVLGNTQTAYGGVGLLCVISPETVEETFPNNEVKVIQKTIDCNAPILSLEFVHEIPACAAVGIGVTFDNVQISVDGVLTGEESLTHNFGPGETASCELQFEVCVGEADDGSFLRGCAGPSQTIVVTGAEPVVEPIVVGGEFVPVETTSLLLAGLQTSAIWMFPVIAGAAGVTAFYLKSRKN